jgi:hypothetical protein
MWRGGYAPRGCIITKPESAFDRLRLLPGTPRSDERTRKGGIPKIDRNGIVDDAAQPRRGHGLLRGALERTALGPSEPGRERQQGSALCRNRPEAVETL